MDKRVEPFLKWAGGKRWLTADYAHVFPRNFRHYHEPFLGGGAVFFHLYPRSAYLSDLNADLIATYEAIRDDWEAICRHLARHQRNHSRDYYYLVRGSRPTSTNGRAARFLYLNRTCWNGLYRVNLKGQFNVPIGTKQAVLLDTDDFAVTSDLLKNATLKACDFEDAINSASTNDFIFVDPPYTARHNNNGFLKYNQHIFSWEDQLRLRAALLRADRRGCLFALTNACHHSVARLYRGFNLTELQRHSVISGEAHGRGLTEELLVTNYKL